LDNLELRVFYKDILKIINNKYCLWRHILSIPLVFKIQKFTQNYQRGFTNEEAEAKAKGEGTNADTKEDKKFIFISLFLFLFL